MSAARGSRRARPGAPTEARLAAVLGLTLWLAIGACSSSGRDAGSAGEPAEEVADVAECLAVSGPLPADGSLRGAAGEYDLTLVERTDAGDGRSVAGRLVLEGQREDLREFAGSDGAAIPGVLAPLYGTTDVRLESVGAIRVGDLASADPEAPGVLVIESQTADGPSILVRFGSDANRRDLIRFDGGFMVLSVREIEDGGFAGTWASGAQGPKTEGYFCAVRVAG